MCDPISSSAKAVEEVAKTSGKAIDAAVGLGRFISKYIPGVAEQALGMLEDRLMVARYERRLRLMQRVDAIHNELSIPYEQKQINLSLAAPLLLEASLQEDDNLQDMYARLLLNATNANFDEDVRRMHVDILSQLGSLDVAILESLYDGFDTPGSENGVIGAFLPSEIVTSLDEGGGNPVPSPEVQIALYNLMRVNCVDSTAAFVDRGGKTSWVAISPLGESLIKCCRT